MRFPNLAGEIGTMQLLESVGVPSPTRSAQKGYARPPAADTGRVLAVLPGKGQAAAPAVRAMELRAGLRVARTGDFGQRLLKEEDLRGVDALIYDNLGVVLVGADDPQQLAWLHQATPGLRLVPEKIVLLPDYLTSAPPAPLQFGPAAGQATWGVAKTTRQLATQYTGRGVKVAVLDTGFDATHPDFAGRAVVAESFVPGETVADGVGHGTHCIGTACGTQDANGVRYGVAPDARIYVGKVLDNSGRGAQSWILNGITWAVQQGCQVISMSLGSAVRAGDGFDDAYESAGQYALDNNCVVLAAAGNESKRPGLISPVGSPANCPSFLSVAAVDDQLGVAPFSCGAVNASQLVDVAAPGVRVYSSWPRPLLHNTISGTSMATPHVAGIVALLWEKYPQATATDIVAELRRLAIDPRQPVGDFGAGFVQAP